MQKSVTSTSLKLERKKRYSSNLEWRDSSSFNSEKEGEENAYMCFMAPKDDLSNELNNDVLLDLLMIYMIISRI